MKKLEEYWNFFVEKIVRRIIGFRSPDTSHSTIAFIYYFLTLIFSLATEKTGFLWLAMLWSAPFVVFAVKEWIFDLKNIKRLIPVPICLFIVLLSSLTAPILKVTSINLNADTVNFTEIGQTKNLDFSVAPKRASSDALEYVSENPSVAKFENGVVRAVGEGTTAVYIKCTLNDVTSGKVTVNVKDDKAEQLRWQEAQDIISAIDSLSNENPLENEEKILSVYNKYNNADGRVKSQVTNTDKLASVYENYSVQRKQADEAAAAKARAEAEAIEKAEREQAAKLEAEREAALAAEREEQNDPTVYIGKSGTKYHRESCGTLKGNGNAIKKSQAEARGYSPCKVCY